MQCRKIVLCFRYFSVFCKTAANLSAMRQFSQSFHPIQPASAAQKCLVISSLILQFHKPGCQFQSFPKSPTSAEILNLSFPLCRPVPPVLPFPVPNRESSVFSPRLDFGSACCKQQCRCHSCNSQYDQDSSDHSLSQQDHSKTTKR